MDNDHTGSLSAVKALLFDVFGTLVDWRSSLISDFEHWSATRGVSADWARLIDAWRGAYAPALDRVRNNPALGFRKLDSLHREALEGLVKEYGISGLTLDDLEYLVKGWHRLNPWPDTVPALKRLKSRYTIAPLSNGNVSLLTAMAKHAGLPWDVVLSAEIFDHYKPDREVYLGAVDMLGLQPHEVMMVASHNFDLAAAQKLGLHTAFVLRPTESGPHQTHDLKAEGNWDVTGRTLEEIAARLVG